MPAYNVQSRVDKCISSVLKQSYENLEIIIINDGSTDGTGEICQQYANQDSRIIYIETTNRGLSTTRNEGLKQMSGDFVTFIDSDDYIGKYFIENLYYALTNSQADMSTCQFELVHHDQGKQEERLTNLDESVQVVDSREALYRMFYHDGMEISPWAKLYSKDLIENITFADGKIYEDILFQPEIVSKTDKIAVYPLADYFHHYSEDSIQHSDFNLNKLGAVDHMEIIFDQYIKGMDDKRLEQAWKYRYFDNICLILFDIDRNEYPEVINSLWEKLKTVRSEVLSDSHPNAKSARIGAMASYLGYTAMRFIFKTYQKVK